MGAYPRDLESWFEVPGFGPALIRPLRPDDEQAYRRAFAQLPAEDVRLRFHAPLGGLTDEMVRRLVHIDYERQMAFVLDSPVYGLSGIVRFVHDGEDSAEAAITVCHFQRGLGLGRLLLQRAAAEARRRGIREFRGDVLRENTRMIALLRRLGGTIADSPESALLVRGTLPLT